MVRETVQFLRRALASETVHYSEFPFPATTISSIRMVNFRFRSIQTAGEFQILRRRQRTAVIAHVWPGNEWIVSSGIIFQCSKRGRLKGMIETAEAAARKPIRTRSCAKSASSTCRFRATGRRRKNFPKRQVAHSILQWEALASRRRNMPEWAWHERMS